MCTRGLPDIYTLSPRACGPWALGVYIRQTTCAHGITINYVGIAFGVKEHLDPACMHGKKIQVQIINTKYLFFGFEDDSIALMDATATNNQ